MGLSHLQHKHRLRDKCKLGGQGIAVDCVCVCVCARGVITPSGLYQPTWPYLEELRGARSGNSQQPVYQNVWLITGLISPAEKY